MGLASLEVLADPTRRRIVEFLADGELTAGELAARFEVTRPAVSRHLRVLREAGLITWRSDAQRRLYRLRPEPLEELAAWADSTRRRWAGRLDLLESHLDANPDTPKGATDDQHD